MLVIMWRSASPFRRLPGSPGSEARFLDRAATVHVQWDFNPTEDVDLSSGGIRLMGKCEQPPPAVRTREEERQMFDESRDSYFKDPHAVARQREREMVDRIADMITSVVIDGAIESATAPLVDGTDEAARVLQEAYQNHLRRRPLLGKWVWYLRKGGLDVDVAVNDLRKAAHHVTRATGRAQRRKLPAASVVSETELRDIKGGDPEAAMTGLMPSWTRRPRPRPSSRS